MNSQGPGDRTDYEAAINALIDGELDEAERAALKAAAADDPVLARAIVDAWRLQAGLDELRLERTPPALARRLRRIPRARRRTDRMTPWRRLAFAGLGSAALAAFAMMMTTGREPTGGPAAGLADRQRVQQARRDLAVAFHYLDRAGALAGRHLQGVLHDEVAEPVTGPFSRNLPFTEQSRWKGSRKEGHS